MEKALGLLLKLLPLIFAIGFLAPVMNAGMQATGVAAPFGLTGFMFSLLVAGAWGMVAQLTGRWI